MKFDRDYLYHTLEENRHKRPDFLLAQENLTLKQEVKLLILHNDKLKGKLFDSKEEIGRLQMMTHLSRGGKATDPLHAKKVKP